jgi:glycosyltransferase involved in cell wall biosynthesis
MKVLHVIAKLEIGGADKLLLDSIPFYIKKGLNVDLLLIKDTNSVFLSKLKELNICNIYSLNINNVYNPVSIIKIVPFLKKYDSVHVHLFPALYWVAIAGILSKKTCKLIFTEHNTHNKRRNKIWLKPIERFIYKQYSKIICISEKTKEHLSAWIGLDCVNEKLQTIHNGIDLSRYEKATAISKAELGIDENIRIILMVARFSTQKNPNTLLKAFSLLNRNEDLCLVFSGDGILRRESETLAKQLGIENRVKFLGVRTDIPELIKSSYICVLSSHWEGFGLAAIEYMAACRPAIVSNVNGLREVVGNAGLLFEPKDTYSLKEKIELLLNDKSKYNEISNACLQKSKEFGIEKMVDSYIHLYDEIISMDKTGYLPEQLENVTP